ncbi:MAG: GGDEF domain-containing protein [Syntrophorhabdaceae bacterium]|nr:GGDEF domain-containing protein [Syntrophorhabdaceae bacterium]
MREEKWKAISEDIDFAFQPIVNIHNGVCLGYEALLRKYEDVGFSSIQELFDEAYKDGCLFKFDILIRKKAIKKFLNIKHHHKFKLFFNLENRIIQSHDYKSGLTLEFIKEFNISPDMLCFEISERHEFNCSSNELNLIKTYKNQTYKIAIDDFGSGYSGLQLLYNTEPDYIKIDRFFINGIESDSKKKLFVTKVVNLAHILGILVIAEGVETEKEFYLCKEINCDYIQGYFIQRPTLDINELQESYSKINAININDKRDITMDRQLLNEKIEYIEPICVYNHEKKFFTDLSVVFEAFRRNKNTSFFPVVNNHKEPVGIIREKELKEYVYSKYGKDLLMNKTIGKTIMDFIIKCQVADINTRLEKILEYYAVDDISEGVLITENGRYVGFLSSRSLLKALNEKNIAIARDQNPLTKLPGNTMIHEFIDQALIDTSSPYYICYFDFDNFKPFNDKYGFRQGDRIILLFSNLLKKTFTTEKYFIGHIGGDDFFLALKITQEREKTEFMNKTKNVVEKFTGDVIAFYELEDRERGVLLSTDRDGNRKAFPLMSVSAAIVYMPSCRDRITHDELGLIIARTKKEAKQSSEKIVLNCPFDDYNYKLQFDHTTYKTY